jgi:cysteine desulfuration protein SufE
MADLSELTEESLRETFEFLDDWEERYRFIIDLGRKLGSLPQSAKTEANRIQGCQSNVWVTVTEAQDAPGHVALAADSEAHIVKGLAAMVVAVLDGRPATEVVAHDMKGFFDGLGLHQHLSPTRSNGLHGMVAQIKTRAAAMASRGS